jgi:hypothetical protein
VRPYDVNYSVCVPLPFFNIRRAFAVRVSTFRVGIRPNKIAASATLGSAIAFRNWSKGASKVRPAKVRAQLTVTLTGTLWLNAPAVPLTVKVVV